MGSGGWADADRVVRCAGAGRVPARAFCLCDDDDEAKNPRPRDLFPKQKDVGSTLPNFLLFSPFFESFSQIDP